MISLFISSINCLIAQPVNDLCENATILPIGADEASTVWTLGTTIGTVDGATTPGPETCSGNFYRDDVWYKFQIPSNATEEAVKIAVRNNVTSGISSVGIAVYTSDDCTSNNKSYYCSNFTAGTKSEFKLSKVCMGVDKYILVRVWSAAGGAFDWETGEGNFEISVYYNDDNAPLQTLWGDKGEGGFAGGLNGWTTTSESCNGYELWRWTAIPQSYQGTFTAGSPLIESLSNCDGGMIFDSDYYDNGGDGSNAGMGPCPAPQSGTLVSPLIDLSGFPNITGVDLVFNQATRNFQSKYYIDYSIDGGVSWDSIEINTPEEDPILYNVNGPHVNNLRRIYLPGVAGKANVKVRFRYEANYYYWIIDDVKIVERPYYDLKANQFYAVAPNKMWQKDQLEGFGGLIDVTNYGAKPSNNAKVNLEIKDLNNNSIWSDELALGTLLPDSTYKNLALPGTFIHPNNATTYYSGIYTVSSDDPDFEPKDNSQSFNWSVTDSTMAKESLIAIGSGVRPSTSFNYTWGNIYHIVNNKDATGKDLFCSNVSVGISNPGDLEGVPIFVNIYKWNNLNGDDIVQADERTTVGFSQYEFPAGEQANTLYTWPVIDFNTFESGIILEANTDYIVAVEYTTPIDKPDLACFICSDGETDYSALTLLSSLPGHGPQRFHHVLDIGNTGDFNANTFTGGTVPVVRMHISPKEGSTPSSADINGKIFVDFNCNGVYDGNETALAYKNLINANTNQLFEASNSIGNYQFQLYNTPFSFKPAFLKNGNTTPSQYDIPNIDSIKNPYDFAFCPNNLIHDVSTSLYVSGASRPGFNLNYQIYASNEGVYPENVKLELDLLAINPNHYQIIDADGGTIQGHKIIWDFSAIQPFQEKTKKVTLNVSSQTPLGEEFSVKSTVSLDQSITEDSYSNNEKTLNQIVVGSYDPNDKNVDKPFLSKEELTNGTQLEYTIRFQNTGNYYAENIVVIDTLPNSVDINTIQIVRTSHLCDISIIQPNIVKWTFNKIYLPDSTANEKESHGFVQFTIRTKPNLAFNTNIPNRAAIYFDFNAPIFTNTIQSALFVSTKNLIEDIQNLSAFPNPSINNKVNISFSLLKSMDMAWQVTDMKGTAMMHSKKELLSAGKHNVALNISSWPKAVYQFKLKSNNSERSILFVKE